MTPEQIESLFGGIGALLCVIAIIVLCFYWLEMEHKEKKAKAQAREDIMHNGTFEEEEIKTFLLIEEKIKQEKQAILNKKGK